MREASPGACGQAEKLGIVFARVSAAGADRPAPAGSCSLSEPAFVRAARDKLLWAGPTERRATWVGLTWPDSGRL